MQHLVTRLTLADCYRAARALTKIADQSTQLLSLDGIARKAQAELYGALNRILDSIRFACADARDRGVRVEQLLIQLKCAWSSSPTAHSQTGDPRDKKRMDQLITLVIHEYYRTVDAAEYCRT
jgi:hypothetical protein